MRRALALAMMFVGSFGASAEELPFSYKVIGVEDTDRSGEKWSVVTVEVKNGSTYLRSANFSCRLAAKSGTTWAISGKTLNYDAKEARSFRIVGETPPGETPASAKCSVTSFERSAPLD